MNKTDWSGWSGGGMEGLDPLDLCNFGIVHIFAGFAFAKIAAKIHGQQLRKVN